MREIHWTCIGILTCNTPSLQDVSKNFKFCWYYFFKLLYLELWLRSQEEKFTNNSLSQFSWIATGLGWSLNIHHRRKRGWSLNLFEGEIICQKQWHRTNEDMLLPWFCSFQLQLLLAVHLRWTFHTTEGLYRKATRAPGCINFSSDSLWGWEWHMSFWPWLAPLLWMRYSLHMDQQGMNYIRIYTQSILTLLRVR